MITDLVQELCGYMSDETTYKANKTKVIQEITLSNKSYINALVEAVDITLKDNSQETKRKYIALFFLKEASTTKVDDLVKDIEEKTIVLLGEIAKGDVYEYLHDSKENKLAVHFREMLIECIYVWGDWFGKDKEGNLTKFQTVSNEVFQKVQKPKAVKRESQKIADETKKSQSQAISELINGCLIDEEHYTQNKQKILDEIAAGNEIYIKVFDNTIREVFEKKSEGEGKRKFAALYFLKETMDTKVSTLVKEVESGAFRRLQEVSNVSQFLGAETENNIKKKFAQLLCECVHVWGIWFSTDKEGDPTDFKRASERINRHPENFIFFKDVPIKAENTSEEIKQSENAPEVTQKSIVNKVTAFFSGFLTHGEKTLQNTDKKANQSEFDKVTALIYDCFVHEKSYKKHKEQILKEITNNNKLYIYSFVETVKKVLRKEKEEGKTKFNSLHFLKEAMDTGATCLINFVRYRTLKFFGNFLMLYKEVCFNEKTNESTKNKVCQLLFECVYLWSHLYGKDSSGNPNLYKIVSDECLEYLEMPKKFHYVKKIE